MVSVLERELLRPDSNVPSAESVSSGVAISELNAGYTARQKPEEDTEEDVPSPDRVKDAEPAGDPKAYEDQTPKRVSLVHTRTVGAVAIKEATCEQGRQDGAEAKHDTGAEQSNTDSAEVVEAGAENTTVPVERQSKAAKPALAATTGSGNAAKDGAGSEDLPVDETHSDVAAISKDSDQISRLEDAGSGEKPPKPPSQPPPGADGDGQDSSGPDRQPDAEPRRISPSLTALFKIGLIFGPEANEAEYVESVYKKNMPPLELQARLHGPLVPLDDESQARIEERAREIVQIPHGTKMRFTDDELQLYQGWLDGIAAGLNDDEIARQLGIPHRSFKRNLDDMRRYLGSHNQAHAVYSLLFHGDEHGRRIPHAQTPELNPNRRLHFYLGALGFELQEVVDLTRSANPRANTAQVGGLRATASQLLVGRAEGGLARAIVGAFRLGHFVTIDD